MCVFLSFVSENCVGEDIEGGKDQVNGSRLDVSLIDKLEKTTSNAWETYLVSVAHVREKCMVINERPTDKLYGCQRIPRNRGIALTAALR